MIDGPIIVITLTGEKDENDALARLVDDARAARTLEVLTRGPVHPEVLQQVSDFCDENDLLLRFQPED